jgi:hypothetical protein
LSSLINRGREAEAWRSTMAMMATIIMEMEKWMMGTLIDTTNGTDYIHTLEKESPIHTCLILMLLVFQNY